MLISGIVLLYSALFLFVAGAIKFRAVGSKNLSVAALIAMVCMVCGMAMINQAFYLSDGLSLWGRMTGREYTQAEQCLVYGVNISTGDFGLIQSISGRDDVLPDISDINIIVTAGLFLLLIAFLIFLFPVCLSGHIREKKKREVNRMILLAAVLFLSALIIIYYGFYFGPVN